MCVHSCAHGQRRTIGCKECAIQWGAGKAVVRSPRAYRRRIRKSKEVCCPLVQQHQQAPAVLRWTLLHSGEMTTRSSRWSHRQGWLISDTVFAGDGVFSTFGHTRVAGVGSYLELFSLAAISSAPLRSAQHPGCGWLIPETVAWRMLAQIGAVSYMARALASTPRTL